MQSKGRVDPAIGVAVVALGLVDTVFVTVVDIVHDAHPQLQHSKLSLAMVTAVVFTGAVVAMTLLSLP